MLLKNNDVNRKRVRFIFSGVVQGVGFRPFIYHLAKKNGLTGFVQNRKDGVCAEVEGSAEAIDAFLIGVKNDSPPLACIANISAFETDILNDNSFHIVASDQLGRPDVLIAPDAATCPECIKELFDHADRRSGYPFINCTNCGPRLTIISGVPYDRINTSMACFPLCPQCLSEYENPADRRFHAEPNACPDCGPQLSLLDADGNTRETTNPMQSAVDFLLAGKILAIKGLGGFHLSVDASNDEAIKTLRRRKYREEKPLAIMLRDIHQAKRIANISRQEENLLCSPQRPIVLLKKIENNLISRLIAPGVPHLGIMLPYTPLHHLLMEKNFIALVMTSANQVDEPICIGNREAINRLGGIADFFLIHNRNILVRCDDSVALFADNNARILRRSRGYVPQPVILKAALPPVLALGGQMKTTLCIIKEKSAYLSPHIGDMETPQARDFFLENISLMKRITETDPEIVACDNHPAYYSHLAAQEYPASRLIYVQHHHAHVVSCMAENKIEGSVIGLAMDGTGYGIDGTAWGGEFLIADEINFQRFGHLDPMILPGGEKAIREPWRIAAGILKSLYNESWPEVALRLKLLSNLEQGILLDQIMERKINSPMASGLGRLFDSAAALLGLSRTVSFEGQAAMKLEALATGASAPPYPFEIRQAEKGPHILDFKPMIKKMIDDFISRKNMAEIAASFHETITDAFVAMSLKIRSVTGLTRIVLSGGCFQNRILLEGSMIKLKNAGFDAFGHKIVPANDGGLSLGQAVVAASIIKKGKNYEIR